MKWHCYSYLIALFLMTACSSLPQLYQAMEEVADDTAMNIKVSREALQKDTNVRLSVDVINAPKQ